MNKIIKEMMDELLEQDNEDDYDKMFIRIKVLIKQLECHYHYGFFSAIELMTIGKSLEEKKEKIRIYIPIYENLELS